MKRLLSCVTLGVMLLPSSGRSQTDRASAIAVDLAAGAVAEVRTQYFRMDYVGGAALADRLLKRFPHSRELAAWRVANLSRISRPLDAKTAADALFKADTNDAWGWFAEAVFQQYGSEVQTPGAALKMSLEAYQRAPGNTDAVWVRAISLSGSGQAAQALALLDSIASRGPLPQQLRAVQANAMYSTASKAGKLDKVRADSAFALYARARAIDSSDVAATTFAASRLLGSGRPTETYELARAGARLSPLALGAHQTYWQSVDALKDRTQSARDSEVLADVDRLLASRPNEPTVLSAAADQYAARRRLDRARELQDRLVAVAPTSLPSEWVFVNRYRAMAKELYDSTSHDTASYSRALWAFIDRPAHVSHLLLGDAYRELFRLTDSTTNGDTLLRIVRGMVKYEGINPHIAYAGGAIRLAERGRDFNVAEQMTRDGLKAGKTKIDEQRNSYETVGDYAHAVDWISAFMYDALGVVYFHEGRLDDAQRELDHARELDPKSATALFHLGQLSEKRGRTDEAERYYIKGALQSVMITNPNRAALQRVYRTTRGSLDGYDAYLAGIAETDRAARRAEVAKTRIRTPSPLQSFQLKTLDGKTISSDSLRGKVTVINNWGMWCGPCVAEMPEIQSLAARYAGDSTVRVLTINNDPNTDALADWMAKRHYTFTTLIDNGFLGGANVHLYPTTWFVDAAGRIVFEKAGWSEKLAEEFGWRIEMVRQP